MYRGSCISCTVLYYVRACPFERVEWVSYQVFLWRGFHKARLAAPHCESWWGWILLSSRTYTHREELAAAFHQMGRSPEQNIGMREWTRRWVLSCAAALVGLKAANDLHALTNVS